MNVKRKKNKFLNSELDFIQIPALEITCKVGCTDEERAFPQLLLVNLSLFLSLKNAGKLDSIKHTIDYAEIAEDIKELIQNRHFSLIEAVAETIWKEILAHKKLVAARIKVSKHILPGMGPVAVSIWREK